ncbi:acyl-CoA carboxylase subunit epsilon [Kytococcus sp. Marseille-QA3725]
MTPATRKNDSLAGQDAPGAGADDDVAAEGAAPDAGATSPDAAAGGTAPGAETPAAEPVVVVPGGASAEELAALTVVFTALGSGGSEGSGRPATGRWGAPGTGARRTPQPGPGAWRASGLPR